MASANFATSTVLLLVSAPALATQPSDLSCEPNTSPAAGSTDAPLNPLLFGFGIDGLTAPDGGVIATLPAPAPWDVDSRYAVPATPLAPFTTYTMTYQLDVATVAGSFTTTGAIDTTPPTAPVLLGHAAPSDPNLYSFCATDRTELFDLALSTDDQTDEGDLRYSLSLVLPDGGLSLLFNELTPLPLPDGGPALAVQYGLEGMPGAYVAQARDLAGNLSAPSSPQDVDIGPGCTFASSTTGRRSGNLWLPLLLLLALRPRAKRG